MKRFVGRPWIQRFQLFATGAQRRGDGDAARSTFPSGSIRRLATRLVFTILMKGVYFRWMFFKCTLFWNQARIKGPDMISTTRYVTVGRFNFQSLIFRNDMKKQHGGPDRFRSIQVLGLQDKLAQGGRARPSLCGVRICWHPKSWFSSKVWQEGWIPTFSYALYIAIRTESAGRGAGDGVSEVDDLVDQLICKKVVHYVWFVPVLSCSTFWDLGKSLGMTWCVVMITQLCCAMCSHMWLMAHRCGSSEGGRHFGGPRPEGKICLWYFVTATLPKRDTKDHWLKLHMIVYAYDFLQQTWHDFTNNHSYKRIWKLYTLIMGWHVGYDAWQGRVVVTHSRREIQENCVMKIYETLENKEGEHSGDDYFSYMWFG